MKKLLYFGLILCWTLSLKGLFAQTTSLEQKIHAALLNMDIPKSDSLLEVYLKTNDKPIYYEYWKSYSDFLVAYFNANDKNFSQFKNSSDKAILKLEEDGTALSLAYASKLSVFRAFLFYLWDEKLMYVKAIIDGRSYLDEIEDNVPEKKKMLGLYEVLGYSVPENYRWIAGWFNIKGNALTGLSDLKQFLATPNLSKADRMEAQIFMMYCENALGLNYKIKPNSNSVVMLYAYLRTTEESAKTQLTYINDIDFEKVPYLELIKGDMLLKLQNEKGLSYLNHFINRTSGKGFESYAQYQIYLYKCIHHDETDCESQAKMVMHQHDFLFPADLKSMESVKGEHCNKLLMKSRLLFDAGEFEDALSLLKNPNAKNELLNLKDKTEYLYRLARNYEEIGQIDKAIDLYKTIINTKIDKWYFVPFSAYKLAFLLAEKNDLILAKQYFEKAIELNHATYQQSIALKVKFALDYFKL
ncbi:MAG: hypothetical protein JXR60_11660 [Bacteroidales bacterium]|nr:hypothetical protein [Bacteroidales bacterium]